MMKYLQKLGKALMLPVAVLPICGILMGIGYFLCPATMQGGEITGAANLIGFFLVKAGGALIDNMALLFVVGVGVGMSWYWRCCCISFLVNDHNITFRRFRYNTYAWNRRGY